MARRGAAARYARYLKQIRLGFDLGYIASTLNNHTDIARELTRLFKTRFYLARKLTQEDLDDKQLRLEQAILTALDDVQVLNEDRILRRYLDLIKATLRTNFYQPDANGQNKSYFSFKFNPKLIPELPKPVPKFEIFVYSPRVEGVHLRFGNVARGGLRWSDREEDFRTEVLGLVKAQQVKNSVIVPVGAKGGFLPRRLPLGGGRDEIAAEGVACYRIFISGLLDITDNLKDGGVVPPATWCAMTMTTRTWWWRPTKARQPSPTSPTASPSTMASGWATPLPRAVRPVTTTRRWALPHAAPGWACSATSASAASTCRKTRSP